MAAPTGDFVRWLAETADTARMLNVGGNVRREATVKGADGGITASLEAGLPTGCTPHYGIARHPLRPVHSRWPVVVAASRDEKNSEFCGEDCAEKLSSY